MENTNKKSVRDYFNLDEFFNGIKDYVSRYSESILNKSKEKIVSPVPEDVITSVKNKARNQVLASSQVNLKQPTNYQTYKLPANWNDVYKVVRNIFGPDEALNMMDVLKGENRGLNYRAENINKDGSIDRGLFQINSKTFADFMRRKSDKLYKEGITSYEDMYDPVKNAKMAKIIWDEQGYKAWYGAPERLRNK